MFRTLTTRQLAFDIALPVVPAVLALLYVGSGRFIGSWVLVLVGIIVGMAAAAALRRLSPGLALGVAWVVAIWQVAVSATGHPANVAIPVVLFATAAYGSKLVRWLGFASAFVGALVASLAITVTSGIDPFDGFATALLNGNLRELVALIAANAVAVIGLFVAALGLFLLSWTLGLLWATWLRAQDNRRTAQRAVQEMVAEQERTRIARDMHDVVAHSLAVVVAQADGARYIAAKDPKATEAALMTISTTAREALSDVRVLLAQLRHAQEDGPQPTLVDLERLYEQLRAAGLTIEEQVTGTPLPLGTAQQLAVYRIVQESLTNALRHADAAQPVMVRFGWTPHGLDLTVSSALRPPTGRTGAIKTAAASAGHGLAGMTERALLVGGHLTAAPDAGRFAVHAWLPANRVEAVA
jgi:signal transduction histidine kinase